MLTAYIKAAMKRAKYEVIEDPRPIFGNIEGLKGVWANEPTEEECAVTLAEVVEGWVLLGAKFGHKIPILDGIDLNMGDGLKEIQDTLALPENARIGIQVEEEEY